MIVGAFYTFGVRLSTVGKGVGSSSLFAESTHTHTHTHGTIEMNISPNNLSAIRHS